MTYASRYNDFALIETMLWTRYVPEMSARFYLLERHVNRLKGSADFFGIALDMSLLESRLTALDKILMATSSERFRVRLLLHSDGILEISHSPMSQIEEPVSIELSKVKVSSSDVFLFHKTTKRRFFDQERKRILDKGIFETIFLNEKGELTQGTITNLYIDLGEGILETPALVCGLLPGTLRQELIDTGKAREKILFPRDLSRAKAIYVGNSLRGLLLAYLTKNDETKEEKT